MTTGEKMREAMTRLGISQSSLAERCNVSQSVVSDYCNDKKTPTLGISKAIAGALGLSLDELAGRDTYANIELLGLRDESYPVSVVRIPVLGRVIAGIPIEAVECILDYEEIPASLARTGEFFGLQIKGDSMQPRILDGDVVIVRKQSSCSSGDIAIVLVNGDDATCKRVVLHENGLSLNALNSAVYPPHFYTTQEIEQLPVEIIGKVVELRGKF